VTKSYSRGEISRSRANGVAERFCTGNADPTKNSGWPLSQLPKLAILYTGYSTERYSASPKLLDEKAKSVWTRQFLLGSESFPQASSQFTFGIALRRSSTIFALQNRQREDAAFASTRLPRQSLRVEPHFRSWLDSLSAPPISAFKFLSISGCAKESHDISRRCAGSPTRMLTATPIRIESKAPQFWKNTHREEVSPSEQEESPHSDAFLCRLDTEKVGTKQLHLGPSQCNTRALQEVARHRFR